MVNNLLRLKTEKEIAKYIDYAFLDNKKKKKDIKEFIDKAKKNEFYSKSKTMKQGVLFTFRLAPIKTGTAQSDKTGCNKRGSRKIS